MRPPLLPRGGRVQSKVKSRFRVLRAAVTCPPSVSFLPPSTSLLFSRTFFSRLPSREAPGFAEPGPPPGARSAAAGRGCSGLGSRAQRLPRLPRPLSTAPISASALAFCPRAGGDTEGAPQRPLRGPLPTAVPCGQSEPRTLSTSAGSWTWA